MEGKKDLLKEIAKEVDTLDDMLTALVELLDEKGVLTQTEWEGKIRQKVTESEESQSYREIQFSEEGDE